MKRAIHLTILLSLLSLLSTSIARAGAADLTIHVDQVKSADGRIMVALYDSQARYLKQARANLNAAAVAGRTTVVFKDLPAGEYAFAVVHDANDNGKMDRKLLGIPAEPYAFSNDATGNMGPPSYADARLSVPTTGSTAAVRLR